jgi:hypothetical protein
MKTQDYRSDCYLPRYVEAGPRGPRARRDDYEKEQGERPARRRRGLSGGGKALLVLGCVVGAFVTLGVVLVVIGLWLGNPHGKEIKLNGGSQLFYTSNVTEAEAQKLAGWLNKELDKAPNAGTFQLNKRGDVYEVRMVVKDGVVDNDVTCLRLQLDAVRISGEVFDNAPVEMHLCDGHLKTIRVLPPLGGAK